MSQTYNLPQPRPVPWSRAVVGAILLAGLIALLNLTGILAQAQALITGSSASSVSYQTSTVSKGNVSVSVTATGPVSAVTSIPLSFKESGRLVDIKVGVGDHVTKGQVLATLDTSDLQVALQQAQATLAQAQANLTKVESGSTSQAIAAAKTSVDNADRSAADAQAGLKTTQANNAANLSAAQAAVSTAQTNLGNANAALSATQDQWSKTIAADQDAITTAQKNLALVQQTAAADVPVLEQQVESAKDTLWSQQISRDAACGHGNGTSCNAANASVAAAQTAVNTAQSQLDYNQKQSAQQIATAQATVDTANLQLSKDQTAQKAAIVSAQNQVNQAESALKSAQVGVTQSQASAAANTQSAQSQITSAANAQQTAQASFNQTAAPPLQTDVDTAKAQVQSAQAAVDAAQANLDSAVLTAPFDGTIAAVNGSVGQWISGGSVAATSGSTASATAIFTEMSLDNLQVVAQVNEADISKVSVGNPVTFNVSAFPGQTFQGKVLSVQPVGTTTSNVVVYNVTSSIEATKSASLYPGMTATVTIVSAEHDGVLTVPATALSFAQTAIAQGMVQAPGATAAATGSRPTSSGTSATRSGTGSGTARTETSGTGATSRTTATTTSAGAAGPSYVVTDNEGKLTLVPVTVGLTNGTTTEVSGNLQPGDTVVVGRTGGATTTRTSSSSGNGSSPFVGGGP